MQFYIVGNDNFYILFHQPVGEKDFIEIINDHVLLLV